MDTFHSGAFPEKMSCFTCDKNNVIVSAIKQAEDGSGNILRFYEMNHLDTSVSFRFFDKNIDTEITHNAIKTLHDNGKELNLMEWENENYVNG